MKSLSNETPYTALRNKLSPLFNLSTMVGAELFNDKALVELIVKEAKVANDNLQGIRNLITRMEREHKTLIKKYNEEKSKNSRRKKP